MKKFYSKTLLRIYFTIFLIVFVMLISCAIIFVNSVSGIGRQLKENNRLMAKSIIYSFEQSFKEVCNFIINVNELPYEAFNPKKPSNMDIYNAHQIINKANKFLPQDYIEDYVIFYKDSPLAITSKGTSDFSKFFKNTFRHKKYSQEYWENFAATKHPMIIVPSDYYTAYTSEHGAYRRKILAIVGTNQTALTKLNIIVFLDERRLLNHINQHGMLRNTSLMVLDQDRNIIINTGTVDDISDIGNIYINFREESVIKGKNAEYYILISDYNDFIYIYKIPYNNEYRTNSIMLNYIILILTILMGLVVSVISSTYLYKPIKKISKLFGEKEESINTKSEYLEIYNGIEKIKKENDKLQKQMNQIEEDVLRSIFLKITDDITYYKDLRDQIDIYFKVILCKEKFAIVSFFLKVARKGDSNLVYLSPQKMCAIVQQTLQTEFINVISFNLESMQIISVIGLNEFDDRKQFILKFGSILEDLRAKEFDANNLTIVISRFYKEVQDYKKAFYDIKMSMAYRNVDRHKNIIDAEEIDYNSELYFPLDSIDKLSNYMLSGNSRESIKIINEIIDTNIKKNINCFKFISIITDIFNNIINVMGFQGIEKKEILHVEREFFEKIGGLDNYEELRCFLNNIVESLTQKAFKEKQSKLNEEFIIQYINLHYAENLYLEKMAELLSTSSKYFSNYFKKTFGVNFVEYNNRVKIFHAKELLKSTDIPISDLYKRVGYLYHRTFTSTFKKHCGVSPTEYRKKHRNTI